MGDKGWPRHFTHTPKISAETRCKQWNGMYAGGEAFFTVDLHGYRHGYVQNRLLSAARVVFAISTGAWPVHHIDHINGGKTDNWPSNLRDVQRAENMKNRAISANSSTGFHGISLRLGKYDAYITTSGKKKHLGRFETVEQALIVRRQAERQLGYHENHGRESA